MLLQHSIAIAYHYKLLQTTV